MAAESPEFDPSPDDSQKTSDSSEADSWQAMSSEAMSSEAMSSEAMSSEARSSSHANSSHRSFSFLDFLRSSFFILLISNCGSAINFIFQLVLARKLTPADYGLMGALIALVNYLTIPGKAIQMVFSRHANALISVENYASLAGYFKQLCLFTAAICLLYLALLLGGSNILQDVYKLETMAELIIVFIASMAGVYYFLGLGFLQSLHYFNRMEASQALLACFRLVIGGTSAALGLSVSMCLLGLLLGPLLIFIGTFFSLRSFWLRESKASGIGFIGITLEVIPLMLTFGAFVALFNLDVICVQHFFGGPGKQEAGLYNAAAQLGKAVLYVPLAIGNLTFAKVARSRAEGEEYRSHLWRNLLITLCLSLCGAGALALFAEPILEYYAGSELYRQAAPLLKTYVWPMAMLGLVSVYMNYYFAIGRKSFAFVILGGISALAVLIYLSHETPKDICFHLLTVNGSLLVISAMLLPFLDKNTTLPHAKKEAKPVPSPEYRSDI